MKREFALCARKIEKLYKNVLYADFFSVILENPDEREDAMPLPGGYCLVADDRKKTVQANGK